VSLQQVDQASLGRVANLFQPGITMPELTFDFLRPSNSQNRPASAPVAKVLINKNQDLATSVKICTVGELDSIYIFDDRVSVGAYVDKHRLHGILALASSHLVEAFGATTRKTLSLVSDDEGSEMLFCIMSVNFSVEKALECLESFDVSWWQRHSFAVGGKLNFDFEFI
jgi:hypothetical protein